MSSLPALSARILWLPPVRGSQLLSHRTERQEIGLLGPVNALEVESVKEEGCRVKVELEVPCHNEPFDTADGMSSCSELLTIVDLVD